MALSAQQDAFALQINQKGSRLMASLIVPRSSVYTGKSSYDARGAKEEGREALIETRPSSNPSALASGKRGGSIERLVHSRYVCHSVTLPPPEQFNGFAKCPRGECASRGQSQHQQSLFQGRHMLPAGDSYHLLNLAYEPTGITRTRYICLLASLQLGIIPDFCTVSRRRGHSLCHGAG